MIFEAPLLKQTICLTSGCQEYKPAYITGKTKPLCRFLRDSKSPLYLITGKSSVQTTTLKPKVTTIGIELQNIVTKHTECL